MSLIEELKQKKDIIRELYRENRLTELQVEILRELRILEVEK